LLSREGRNVAIVTSDVDGTCEAGGPYGAEGYVLQAFHPLAEFDGYRPMLGCWLVASQAAGLGIREDRGLITTNDARFIPHVIVG
jgi:glutathionylspermidine synthase